MPDIPLSSQQLNIKGQNGGRSIDLSRGVNKAIDSIGGLLGVETPEEKQDALKRQQKLNALAVKNQHDSALVSATEEQLLFSEEVVKNPGNYNNDDIDKRITEINETAAGGIIDLDARNSFANSIKIPSVKTGITLRAERNQYEINQADVNTTKALNMLNAGPDGLTSMNRIIDEQVDFGVYTYDQGQILKKNTRGTMVLKDAEVSPELTLERLKDEKTDYYGIDDPAQRNSLINQVLSIEAQDAKINALKEAKAHTVSFTEELNLLDDPDATYTQKADSIDRKIKTGAVSEEIGKVLNKALLSKYWGDSETELSTFSDLILKVASIDSTESATEDLKTSKAYLDTTNLVKNMIVSARSENKLTKAHYERLINDLNKKVAKKEGEALEQIGKEDRWGWYFDPSHANEKFVKNFEDNPFLQQDALKSYYLATEGVPGLDNERKEQIADNIISDIKGKQRDAAFNVMQELPLPGRAARINEPEVMKRLSITEKDITDTLAANKNLTRAKLFELLANKK